MTTSFQNRFHTFDLLLSSPLPCPSKGSAEVMCILKISCARKHSFTLQWEEGEEERGPCPTSKETPWAGRGQEIALLQAFPLLRLQMIRLAVLLNHLL